MDQLTMVRGAERQSDAGSALLIALLGSMLLAAVGQGLILLTNTDQAIAANHQAGIETLYAADAGLSRAVAELRRTADWTGVLAGAVPSSFIDGTRSPLTPGGETIDLDAETAALQAQSNTDPWGANNARWRLYAYGPLAAVDASICSRSYVAIWVADDPAEVDGNALVDSNRVLLLHAEAFGTSRARRNLIATFGVPEHDLSGELRPRMLSWREVR